MNPKSQLRHGYGPPPPTFSASAMAITFTLLAVVSFAVDQTMILSSAAAEGRIELLPRPIGDALAEFNPVRLIGSLIDAGSDRSDDLE